MGFEAKYHGTCGSCEEKIKPGQRVKYVDDELVHEDCEASAPPPVILAEICANCFMEKSVSGECACTR